MSGPSRSHLTRDAQRRFRWAFLLCAAVLLLLVVPLMLNPELRLSLAQRFNLVPGADIEQIGTGNDGQTLVVLPLETPDNSGHPTTRYLAAGIFRETSANLEFMSIETGTTLALPLDSPDFYAGSLDGRYLLVRDTDGQHRGVTVLIDLSDDTVSRLPDGAKAPDGIEGHWDQGAWEVTPGLCGGNSPHLKYVECFKRPKLASYLAGDWQLVVRKYGNASQVTQVYRGLGFYPWAGWTRDDSVLYFQNERGIWKAPIDDSMFSDS